MFPLLIAASLPGAAPCGWKSARSPEAAVMACHLDALRIHAYDLAQEKASAQAIKDGAAVKPYKPTAPFVRYFWLPTSDAERDDFLIAFKGQLNHLSFERDFCTPTLITHDVIRLDVRDLGWAEKQLLVFEKFAALDVTFHAPLTAQTEITETVYSPAQSIDAKKSDVLAKGANEVKVKAGDSIARAAPWLPQKEMDGLREMLVTECPLLNAEWFFVATARQENLSQKDEKAGYYDFLLIKSRADYFELVGLDEARAIKAQRETRAVIESGESGVAQKNRQLVALDTLQGVAWGTLDARDESEKNRTVAMTALLRGEFQHFAERWYGHLRNGLAATLLATNKGVIQAKAPPEVGGSKAALNAGNDTAIHIHVGCLACHGVQKDMVRPFRDAVRGLYKPGSGLTLFDPDADRLRELRRLYLTDVDKQVKRDQEHYADAYADLTRSAKNPKGLTVAEFTRITLESFNRIGIKSKADGYAGVTLDVAARELGHSKEEVVAGIQWYRKTRGVVDQVVIVYALSEPGSLTREQFESRYALLKAVCRKVATPEELRKLKPADNEEKK